MKNLIVSTILMLLAISNNTQAAYLEQKDTTLSLKILDLPITLLSGETLTLGQYKGNKPIYLKFWATWCQSCLKQMPHLQHTYDQYGKRVEIIAVNIGVNDDAQSVMATQKKYSLTMPIAIDKSGELAKAFNLMGTPYHVLIDAQSNVVYAGYEETTGLDKRIKRVASGKAVKAGKVKANSDTAPINMKAFANKPTALFFVATWCDWYLKDSQPEVSQNCIAGQNQVNALYTQYPQVHWLGIASRLWTGAPELAEYKKKFNVQHPLAIDATNSATLEYHVKNYPTLILLNKGKEVFRTRSLDAKTVSSELEKLTVP